jgi:hypothetical protein
VPTNGVLPRTIIADAALRRHVTTRRKAAADPTFSLDRFVAGRVYVAP